VISMDKVIAYCVTAVIVSIVIAGGINRAAFYFSTAVIAYLSRRDCEVRTLQPRKTQHGEMPNGIREEIHRKRT